MIKSIKNLVLKYFKILLITYIIYYIVKYLIYRKQKQIFDVKKISNDDLIHPENAYIFAYFKLDSLEHIQRSIINLENLVQQKKDYTLKKISKLNKIINNQTNGHISYYQNDNQTILFLFQHRYFDGRTVSKILSENICNSNGHDNVKQIKYTYIPVWEELQVLNVLYRYFFKTKSSLAGGIEKYHRFNRFMLLDYSELHDLRDSLKGKMSIIIAWKTLQLAHQFSKKSKLNVLVIATLTSNRVPSNNNVTFFFLESIQDEDYKNFEKRFKKSYYILNTISGIVEMGFLHKLGANGKIDVNLSILPPDIITNDNFCGCTQRLLPISIFTYSNKNKKITVSFQINSQDIDPNLIDEVLYSQCPYSKDIEEVEKIMNIFDDITPYPNSLYDLSIKEKYRVKNISNENYELNYNQQVIDKDKNNEINIQNYENKVLNNNEKVIDDEEKVKEDDENVIDDDEKNIDDLDKKMIDDGKKIIGDINEKSFNQYLSYNKNYKLKELGSKSNNIQEIEVSS